jgi:hypothetical protein
MMLLLLERSEKKLFVQIRKTEVVLGAGGREEL